MQIRIISGLQAPPSAGLVPCRRRRAPRSILQPRRNSTGRTINAGTAKRTAAITMPLAPNRTPNMQAENAIKKPRTRNTIGIPTAPNAVSPTTINNNGHRIQSHNADIKDTCTPPEESASQYSSKYSVNSGPGSSTYANPAPAKVPTRKEISKTARQDRPGHVLCQRKILRFLPATTRITPWTRYSSGGRTMRDPGTRHRVLNIAHFSTENKSFFRVSPIL